MKISKGKYLARFPLCQHRKLKQLIQVVKLVKTPDKLRGAAQNALDECLWFRAFSLFFLRQPFVQCFRQRMG
jgi:hypothetical protein